MQGIHLRESPSSQANAAWLGEPPATGEGLSPPRPSCSVLKVAPLPLLRARALFRSSALPSKDSGRRPRTCRWKKEVEKLDHRCCGHGWCPQECSSHHQQGCSLLQCVHGEPPRGSLICSATCAELAGSIRSGPSPGRNGAQDLPSAKGVSVSNISTQF